MIPVKVTEKEEDHQTEIPKAEVHNQQEQRAEILGQEQSREQKQQPEPQEQVKPPKRKPGRPRKIKDIVALRRAKHEGRKAKKDSRGNKQR